MMPLFAALFFFWALAAHSLPVDSEKAGSIRLTHDVLDVPIRFTYDAQPCIAGSITIALDSSSKLSAASFQRQLDFLIGSLLTDEWNHLDRLAFIQYNDEDVFFQRFTADQTVDDVRQQLSRVEQQNQASLRNLLENLDRWQTERPSEPVHLIIFTSEASSDDFGHMQSVVQSLQNKNYVITFVAVGSEVEIALLTQLSSHVIVWDIENEQQPANWQQFEAAFGCAKWPIVSTTTKSPTTTKTMTTKKATTPKQTTTTQRPTTQSGDVYIPCGDSRPLQVNVFVDDSTQGLTSYQFNKVKTFLSTQLFNEWNHFERLLLAFCDAASCLYRGPNAFGTLEEVQIHISGKGMYSYSSAIGINIQDWVQNRQDQLELDGFQQRFVYFTSKFDQTDAEKLRTYASRLDGPLTIVAVNSANRTLIKEEGYPLIDWHDIDTNDKPTNWEMVRAAYGCSAWPTTARPTTTTSTPSSGAFLPCNNDQQRQINFFIDDSSKDLTFTEFKTVKNFLRLALLNNWNEYRRLSLHFCDSESCLWYGPNYFTSWETVDAYLDTRRMYSYTSSVGKNIKSWVYINRELDDYAQSYIYFAAKFDQSDVDLLNIYAPKLNGNLTFVGLKDVDQSLIRQSGYSVIDWSDLTQSAAPAHWEQRLWKAYGCSGNSPVGDDEAAFKNFRLS